MQVYLCSYGCDDYVQCECIHSSRWTQRSRSKWPAVVLQQAKKLNKERFTIDFYYDCFFKTDDSTAEAAVIYSHFIFTVLLLCCSSSQLNVYWSFAQLQGETIIHIRSAYNTDH